MSDGPANPTGKTLQALLRCTSCQMETSSVQFLSACPQCQGRLEYIFEGSYGGEIGPGDDQWRFFSLIPLADPQNILSLGVGNSEIIELTELTPLLNDVQLFLKMDFTKNPTGTFKDREASIILSKCREAYIDNLVFYSTANTGRAYTHFAAHLGLTTYFFMPRECLFKNTASIKKQKQNFIIAVDAHYPEISGYAKRFATENHLTAIAPLHDRTESYATVAYEQWQQLPRCDFFVQTIASGMGVIGFVRGHLNLIRLGLERREEMPRIVAVQSQETNAMYRAYQAGKAQMSREDLPTEFPAHLFEPTLNSTNPVNNYPDLQRSLQESNGLITDAAPADVERESGPLLQALERRNIHLRTDLEKSLLIGFTGIVRLIAEGQIGRGQRVLLMGTGRGNDTTTELIPPDLTIRLTEDEPGEVKRRLDALLGL